MTEIQPFTFPTTGQAVRTLLVDGEPWFVASDLAAILGYRDAFNALRILDEDEKGTHLVSTPGGEQLASVVSEAGLYGLALRSTLDNAKPFRRWVTHEVIPAIRKAGSYSLPRLSQDPLAELERQTTLTMQAVAIARQERDRADRAEFQVLELAPAAHAWDELMEAHGDYDAAQAAQILARDPAIKTGRDRLLTYMDSIGWTYKHGKSPRRAYQTQVDLGRLRMAPTHYDHPRTGERTLGAPKVVVTVKGLFELHKRLGGMSQLNALMSEEVPA